MSPTHSVSTLLAHPTTWDHIRGHDWAIALLRAAIQNGRIGHAYLFTGPEQVGKTTLARAFAQALNCRHEDVAQRPCGQCRTCKLIAADRHPDVILLQPEVSGRGKLTLKIEQIRELQQRLNLSAYEGGYKIAILKQFDAATPGAANAFLKTLEEPPRNVILLLTAAEADTLLPTISSRCRTLPLRPVPTADIAAHLLENNLADEERAQLLAAQAAGRMGWAIQAAGPAGVALLETRRAHLRTLHEVLAGRRIARFEVAGRLAKRPEELPLLLRTWLSWWRDLALLAYGGGDGNGSISNLDDADRLYDLAHTWAREGIVRALQQTGRALWQLEHNANTLLVLENLFLAYPYEAEG